MPDEQKSLINIKDLSGLGASLTKLLETIQASGGRISDGVSRLANAYFLAGRDSENKAQDILLTGRANNQVLLEQARAIAGLTETGSQQLRTLEIVDGRLTAQLTGISPELAVAQEQGLRRVVYQNTMRQLNLDIITAEAAADLVRGDENVSAEPVNQDWANRFFRYGEDIGTESMQVLWGKILAGEIRQPNSFSLRTLEILRNLSVEEAEAFADICNYGIRLGEANQKEMFLYKGAKPFINVPIWERVGYKNILLLIECGLLQSDAEAHQSFTFTPDVLVNALFIVGSRIMQAKGFNTHSGPLMFPVYNLTTAGNQLSKLVTPSTPLDYVFDFAKPFLAFDLEVLYGDFSHWSEDGTLNSLQDNLESVPPLQTN